MKTKKKATRALKIRPLNASYGDAIESLLFLSKVEQGLEQADAGRTIAHHQVKLKMRKWLK